MRRDARWKYIYYTAPEPPLPGEALAAFNPLDELYEPGVDPGEMHNLAGDPAYADVVAEQRAKLLAYVAAQGAPLRPFVPVGLVEDY